MSDLSATDFRWIGKAVEAAQRSSHRVRVGAVVISKKSSSVGWNKIKNHPAIDWENASVHAERVALRNAHRGGSGGVIYIARLGARGALLPSFPCERCQEQIAKAKIKKIVWWNGERWVKYGLHNHV